MSFDRLFRAAGSQYSRYAETERLVTDLSEFRDRKGDSGVEEVLVPGDGRGRRPAGARSHARSALDAPERRSPSPPATRSRARRRQAVGRHPSGSRTPKDRSTRRSVSAIPGSIGEQRPEHLSKDISGRPVSRRGHELSATRCYQTSGEAPVRRKSADQTTPNEQDDTRRHGRRYGSEGWGFESLRVTPSRGCAAPVRPVPGSISFRSRCRACWRWPPAGRQGS